mgnify:CR=1 FL=1
MKFSLYSKKNRLDEMQEQTMRKIESHGFCGAAFWRRGSCRRCSGLRTRPPESGSYS